MAIVRKTGGGEVTIHNVGTFAPGDEREVDERTAAYLLDERSDFERVGFDKDGATDVEYTETEPEGSEADEVPIADLIEMGDCPWCEDYSGDHVGQHASSAHEEEWADYQEGED